MRRVVAVEPAMDEHLDPDVCPASQSRREGGRHRRTAPMVRHDQHREPLPGEGREVAQPLLHRLQLERGAPGVVDRVADHLSLDPRSPERRLLEPLLQGQADICIGDRNIVALEHMSWQKRQLQRLGSWVVRQVSNTSVPDTTSGFRAYTREAALRMAAVVVQRTAAIPAIDAWGAENEPYVPSSRASEWKLGRDYVQQLVSVIRENDPAERPIVISHGQVHAFDLFLDTWQETLEDADIAGMLAGVAGGLHAVALRGIGQSSYPASMSLLVFSMAVIGGVSSFGGALAGVVIVQWAGYLFPDAQVLITGVGLLAILLVIPGGLTQGFGWGRDRFVHQVARRRGLVEHEEVGVVHERGGELERVEEDAAVLIAREELAPDARHRCILSPPAPRWRLGPPGGLRIHDGGGDRGAAAPQPVLPALWVRDRRTSRHPPGRVVLAPPRPRHLAPRGPGPPPPALVPRPRGGDRGGALRPGGRALHP